MDATPIINNLPNEVFLFGVSGGVIVTVLLSALKHYGIVGKEGKVPTQVANFILSVLVAAGASAAAGQDFLSALLAAFASMVAASGLHETVGHAVAKTLGKS